MSENHLITNRKAKVTAWKNAGFSGYATKFDRTHTTAEAKTLIENETSVLQEAGRLMKEQTNSEYALCGRIMQLRDMGKMAFLKIRDKDGDFQICLAKNVLGDGVPFEKGTNPEPGFKWFIKNLDLGDFVGFRGEFFVTKHGEPTLMAATVEPLSKAIRPLPEKFHGLTDRESCYRERNLDLATNAETFERFRLRSKLVQEVRAFFAEKQFDEIETSILQGQAGGAMAEVFTTHHKALDHDFVLRIALELDLKRAVSGGMERIFEIGKNFRNEGTDPSHLQEFTMCEWYAAYQDLETNKEWTEELFHRLCAKVFGKTVFTVVDTEGNETTIDFGGKFAEKGFPQLLQEYADLDMFTATDDAVRAKAKEVGVEKIEGVGRANLLDDIYKKTARCKLIQPTFVYDYPEDLKPLAAPNGDGTASCFQLVVNTWEIVNSYGELIDPMVQRALFEKQSAAKAAGDVEAMEIDTVFLEAMEHGFPPMTGSGFGIDRLCAIFSGQANLRDVVLFPTLKPVVEKLSSKQLEAKYQAKKVVIIANQDLPRGVTANAIGQLGISIGGHSEESLFEAKVLHDADDQVHYTDCFYGMVNLAGSQAQMAEFVTKCYDAKVQVFDFSDIMRKAHTDAQMQKGYKAKKTTDIEYIAVGALVPADFEKEFLSGLALFS